MTDHDKGTLSECVTLMQSADSLTREVGFQRLRPYAQEFAEELAAMFRETSDPDLRYRLFILLVESKAPQAQNVIRSAFEAEDKRLVRTYDALTGHHTAWAYPALPGTPAGPVLLQLKPTKRGSLIVFFLPYMAAAMLGSLAVNLFSPAPSLPNWLGNITGYSLVMWLLWPTLRDEYTLTLTQHELSGPRHGGFWHRQVIVSLAKLDRTRSLHIALWQKLLHYRVICSTDESCIAVPLLLYGKTQLSELFDRIELQGLLDDAR